MESMTTKQACAFLQIGRVALASLVRKGKLRQTKIGNRNLYVADEVRALLIGDKPSEAK